MYKYSKTAFLSLQIAVGAWMACHLMASGSNFCPAGTLCANVGYFMLVTWTNVVVAVAAILLLLSAFVSIVRRTSPIVLEARDIEFVAWRDDL